MNKTNTGKLERLGIHTDMELVLHLPSRYEDETKLTSLAEAMFRRIGHIQTEGVITLSEIQYRPRRQLVVFLSDGANQLVLRFLHFYASQQKQLALGKRVRARGELRQGFNGMEMVHPVYKIVDENTPLPDALTPVYPTSEGVSQNFLRKAINEALERIDLSDTLPDAVLNKLDLPGFEKSIRYLHTPGQCG